MRRGLVQSHDHYFRGFDQRGSRLTHFKAHLLDRVGGDHRSDFLPANRKPKLRHQSFDPEFGNAADQLIAPTDATKLLAALWSRPLAQAMQKAIEFRARDAMVAASSLYAAYFTVVDPLFQGGVTHPQHPRSFTRSDEITPRRQNGFILFYSAFIYNFTAFALPQTPCNKFAMAASDKQAGTYLFRMSLKGRDVN